jgi:DNA-binding protein HU-beta
MLDLQPRNLLYIRELPQQRQEVAVNRTELAEAVAGRTGLDRRHSEAAVEAVTEAIIAEVRAGNRVSIFGFGSFDPRTRAARVARNPQTQATVRVPASKTVAFKPAAAFKDALNKGKSAPAKKAAPAKAGSAKKGSAKKAAAKSAPAKAAKAAKKR